MVPAEGWGPLCRAEARQAIAEEVAAARKESKTQNRLGADQGSVSHLLDRRPKRRFTAEGLLGDREAQR